LLLCGNWTVRNQITIGDNATLAMNGSLTLASNDRRRNLTVGEGATFRVEGGTVTIWGDLILEDNATLEFLGDDTIIAVHGDVIRSGSETITGNFTDAENKF